jgi:hypothetical protein
VNTATGAVLQTFAITAPSLSVVSTDGTKLFVVRQPTNQIYPITLATGVVGTAISVAAGPWKPVAQGAYIYVPGSGSGSADAISRIAVSDHSVTTLATGGNTDAVALALVPNDPTKMWVLEKTGTKRAREIDLTTFTFTGRTVTGILSQSPNDLGISPSGRSMVIIGSGTGDDMQTFVIPATEEYESTAGGDLARIVISNEGDIFAINQVDAGMLHHWHSSSIEIDPTDDFWGGYMQVTATPAEEV